MNETFHPDHTNEKRMKLERERARALKASPWWKEKVREGRCAHCDGVFAPHQLTMDHLIPLARGGESRKNNIVPACLPCNQSKRAKSPLDDLFARIAAERKE